jgi:hypothetical protein
MIKKVLQAIAALACLALAAAAPAQNTVGRQFAGVAVNLVIPKGYCIIPWDDEVGAMHYVLQQQANQGADVVAALFADCKEWADYREGRAPLLKHHGSYLFQLTKGQEVLEPDGSTRADVIKFYEDYERKNGVGSLGPDLTAKLKEQLAKSWLQGVEVQGNMNLGLLDRDPLAAYLGVSGSLLHEGKTVQVVGVAAATLARRVPTNINLFAPASKRPFEDLLVQQKALVKLFLAANE